MTNNELSNAFDVLLSSYSVQMPFGHDASTGSIALDEYEKSYLLTKAQEELVEDLYAGKSIEGESYEETERLRRSLANLNTEMEYEPVEDTKDYFPISEDSQFFQLDNDIMFITYEAVRTEVDNCLRNKRIEVVPVKQDWFHRQGRNPFRGPSKTRALRLDLSDNVVEIVYPLAISKYYVKYLRKPRPIVLQNLDDNLSVHQSAVETSCELDERLHEKIVDRAVMLALRSRGVVPQPREPRREERE